MYLPLQSVRLYEQMAEQIKDRILKNELKEGDRLPNEREFAEQFNVSRTVVREAIKSLEKEGLIEVHPGKGTFVSTNIQKAVRGSFSTLMRMERSEDWTDLIEVRELLEPGISFLAAQRAEAKNIEDLEKAVSIMDAALEDAEAYINADNNFHLALARSTQNELLVSLVEPIVGLLTVQRKKIFNTGGGPQRGQFHHHRILEAIRGHAAESARQAMLDHLQQVRDDSQV
jgi:GntR family transcriptional repressor for pyruvate dehydrogenase complex